MAQPYKYGTADYWKNADIYRFDIEKGGHLEVYAYSIRAAKLKAHNWMKWLKRTNRGEENVLIDTVKKVFSRSVPSIRTKN